MKFIMVIIFCIAADVCETIYETEPYNTQYECQQESAKVRNYMIEEFPNSAGEIYCLNQEEFMIFQQWMEDGHKPTLSAPIGPADA